MLEAWHKLHRGCHRANKNKAFLPCHALIVAVDDDVVPVLWNNREDIFHRGIVDPRGRPRKMDCNRNQVFVVCCFSIWVIYDLSYLPHDPATTPQGPILEACESTSAHGIVRQVRGIVRWEVYTLHGTPKDIPSNAFSKTRKRKKNVRQMCCLVRKLAGERNQSHTKSLVSVLAWKATWSDDLPLLFPRFLFFDFPFTSSSSFSFSSWIVWVQVQHQWAGQVKTGE